MEQHVGSSGNRRDVADVSSPTMDEDTAEEQPIVGDGTSLGLVRTLCATLEEHGILYCHWKSNWELDRSASGDNDLDLLVSSRDAHRFTTVLGQLGFKQARGRSAQRFPGILHHYGLDPGSGRLVHVHAHHHLVIGDDMTKNYRVPLEDAFLKSSTRGPLFRIPAPEFEFVLFVLRMALKHCTLDAALSTRRTLSRSERIELEHLTDRVDLGRVREVVRAHLPLIDEALFDDCMRALRPGTAQWARVSTGHRLQHSLTAYGRHPQVVDGALRVWRRQSRRLRRRLLGPTTTNTLDRGCVIAIVGGDGAGKTSAVEELSAWLAASFRTERVHLGKPPRSLLALVVRRSLRIGRLLGLVSGTPLKPVSSVSDTRDQPGGAWLVIRVLRARDRYRTYLRATRFAARGGVVISDRYPMPQIQLMDHPRGTSLLGSHGLSRATTSLVKLEQRYYDRIMSPDLVIVLKVDPEVALRRKGDDEPAAVRARSAEVWNLEWGDTEVYIVDAGRSKDEVLSEIKSWVWPRL
jgi:thymidylate kinase